MGAGGGIGIGIGCGGGAIGAGAEGSGVSFDEGGTGAGVGIGGVVTGSDDEGGASTLAPFFVDAGNGRLPADGNSLSTLRGMVCGSSGFASGDSL
jgi:hypothetical protein